MVQILDDEHLESLLCFECHKYLSVLPIKNYPNRDVKCGRCCKADDKGVQSLYDLIAKQCLFKCVNRYEGCRKLLTSKEVPAHEAQCQGTSFVCPNCEDAVSRSVLDLIWHYKFKHGNNYLKKNSFKTNLVEKDAFLYVQDDILFFIFYKYLISSKTLKITAVTLSDIPVKQEFTVVIGSFAAVTTISSCKTINEIPQTFYEINIPNMPLESVKIHFDLNISKNNQEAFEIPKLSKELVKVPTVQIKPEFEKMNPNYTLSPCGTALINANGDRIDLKCFNCKWWIGCDITYICLNNKHYLCESCKNWCDTCKCTTKMFYSSFIGHLLYPCRWGCGNMLSNIRHHELSCSLNMKCCPLCSDDVAIMSLQLHMKVFHDKNFIPEFYLEYEFLTRGTTYFLICNVLFMVECKSTFDDVFQLNFTAADDVKNTELIMILNDLTCRRSIDKFSFFDVNTTKEPKLHLQFKKKKYLH